MFDRDCCCFFCILWTQSEHVKSQEHLIFASIAKAKAAFAELQSHCSAKPLKCVSVALPFVVFTCRFHVRCALCDKRIGNKLPLCVLHCLFYTFPSRYSLGMGLNYQQLLKNVPMGAGGTETCCGEILYVKVNISFVSQFDFQVEWVPWVSSQVDLWSGSG